MTQENWLPVRGFEGLYEVSDHGNVLGIIYSDEIHRVFEDQESASLYDFAGVHEQESVADTAKNIGSGARRAAYGRPEQNFERIARFWQSYFENTGRGCSGYTP